MPLAPSFLGTSIMLALGKLDVLTAGTTLYTAPCHPKELLASSESTSRVARRHILTRPLRAAAPSAQCRRAHPPVLFIDQSENSSAILWRFKNYSLSLPTTSVSLNRLLLSDILEKDVYERYLLCVNLANSNVQEETQPERPLRVYCTLFAFYGE